MPDGLLCLLAHPDDESFMAAGTLAMLADRGVATAIVCCTRGQAGSAGTPPLVARDALPARREAELREACALLGVGAVELLEFADRALAEAPLESVRPALVAAVRRHRPQVVLTFDPDGLNRHPDHVAVSRFALDAVTAAADPRWYPEAGAPHQVARVLWPSPVPAWEEWRPERLAERPGVDVVCPVERWSARKAAALRAHRTQHASVERYWFEGPGAADALRTETFRLGWGTPFARRPAADPLEGLQPGR
jgi:LmbE family N-acetylglucosaminyl deacetylase